MEATFLPRVPAAWQTRLAVIRDGVPHSVIAGGCLRDLVLTGSPAAAKDVDIFVPLNGNLLRTVKRVIEAFGTYPTFIFDRNDIDRSVSAYGEWNNDLAMVIDFAGDDVCSTGDCAFWSAGPAPAYQVNILTTELPRLITWGDAVTNEFDLGINRIYYDGNAVVETAAFSIDYALKQFTVLTNRNDAEAKRVAKRLRRLKGRYPQFTVNADETIKALMASEEK